MHHLDTEDTKATLWIGDESSIPKLSGTNVSIVSCRAGVHLIVSFLNPGELGVLVAQNRKSGHGRG
jgi:hypothetical protein